VADKTMKLWPRFEPRLPPEHYVLHVEQEIEDDPASNSTDSSLPPPPTIGSLPSRDLHVDVTGPQFAMPGTEVFGVFPPPNASGPFAARLAQIVLKRRTLPWERSERSDRATPWLALVVLAEAEATFLSNVDARLAYTTGKAPADLPSGAVADCIEVSRTVMDRAFPAQEELEVLAHVREVDTSASEYADEDGFVAVLLSNRLPLPGTTYGAYLISLEGQLEALPEPGDVASDVDLPFVWADLFDSPADVPRLVFEGRAGPTRINDLIETGDGAARVVAGVDATDSEPTAVDSAGRVLGPIPVAESTGGSSATVGLSQGFVHHDVDLRAIERLLGAVRVDPKFRFPVLAHWSFECSQASGDFRGYMVNLDVGLMGTATADPADRRAPVPETTPTGHVGLDHVDRRGRKQRSWYRGPAAPGKVTRGPSDTVFHLADQAAKVVAERRLDISYSSAFEIGRLLAMSDTQFLRALRSWARERFALARVVDVTRPVIAGIAPTLAERPFIDRELVLATLEPGGIGGDPRDTLGHLILVHEAVELIEPRDIGILADGLGLDRSLVSDVLGVALTTASVEPGIGARPDRGFDDVLDGIVELGELGTVLGGEVAAERDRVAELGRLVDLADPDALRDLIERGRP